MSNSPTLIIRGLQLGKARSGKFVKMANWRKTFFLADDGNLYSSQLSGSQCQMFSRAKLGECLDPTELKALVKLGILTSAEVKTLIASAKEAARAKKKVELRYQFSRCAEKLGLPAKEITRLLKAAT